MIARLEVGVDAATVCVEDREGRIGGASAPRTASSACRARSSDGSPVGSFPDRASALRLSISVALRVMGVWTDRRYLDSSVFEKQEA